MFEVSGANATHGPVLPNGHDVGLVVLSVAIALLAALAAFAVVDRARAARRRPEQVLWLSAGSVALGSGIWAMHFLGMLALVLPVRISFNLWMTLASIVPAVLGSAVALTVLSRQFITWSRLHWGGMLMALGIGSMHYVGMAAMQMDALMSHDRGLILLSVLVAYVLACLALFTHFALRHAPQQLRQPVSALVLGGAAVGMHYTAMASTQYFAGGHHGTPGAVLPTELLVLFICLAVCGTLLLTVTSTIVHRRLSDATAQQAASAIRHATVLQTMADGVITFDRAGRIESTNRACQRLFGYTEDELRARDIDDLIPGAKERAQSSLYCRSQPCASCTTQTCDWRMGEVDGRHADGSPIALELSLAHMSIGDAELFSGTVHDIRERRRVDQALRDHVARLEEAGRQLVEQQQTLQSQAADLAVERDRAQSGARAKADFLANMSHEIRTPMNAVLGMLELLQHSELEADQRQFTEIAHRTATVTLTLIDDILDFSKIEAGKITLEHIPFSVDEIVSSSVALMAPQARQRKVDLSCHVESDHPTRVLGDPNRLRQILFNLISNALKFTEAGRVAVCVTAAPRGDQESAITIEVSDTGVGMSPDVLSRLFQPFSQADSSTTRRFGGTGLGLSICRRLADLMDATLTVESTEGAGTTFTLRGAWPNADVATPVPSAPSLRLSLTSLVALPRLLVVEDNRTNQIVVEGLLKRLGISASIVPNGAEACRVLAREVFDVVLMDCQMPVMDGYEATRQIRQREHDDGTRVWIVAMTASAMPGDRERCLAVGMNDYVAKPLSLASLHAALIRYDEHQRPPMRHLAAS